MRKELKLFRATLLSSGAALAMAAPAFAQDADEQSDEIVVTGFRSSLENSVAAKRDNQSIVEAVSAEEIGKLPDISIAESLGRLPGLATQRLNGRSNVLSIRGLGPDFSTALLNGREQVTTSDNRGVEFDQYPAELLSQAVVYKTPYAGLIGQGLAGTVDLRTIRPLDKSESVFAVSGRYEFNEDGSINPDAPGHGYRATAAWVDQFADDTVGFAVGLSLQSSPTQQEAFSAWGYAGDGSAGNPFVVGGTNGRNALSNDLDRIGGFATLQFQPTEDFSSTFDVFYSDFNEDQPSRGIEFPLGFNAFGVTTTVNDQVDGFATDVTFNNVRGVIRNDLNLRRAGLLSTGWNGKWDTDTWGVEMDISYSRAKRNDELIESYSGTGFNPSGAVNTLQVTQAPGGVPVISSLLDYSDPADFVLTDPLGWGGGVDVVQAGFINAPRTVDELWHLKGAVNRDFDAFISNVEVGVDWGFREKTRNIDQSFLTLGGGTLNIPDPMNPMATIPNPAVVTSLPIPAGALIDGQTTLGFLGLGAQPTYDPLYLINNGVYVPFNVQLSSFSVAQDWTVEEDIFQAWIKFGVDTEIGGMPLTGNFGVQLVNTDQSSTGFRIPTSGVIAGTLGATATPVTQGDDYWDVLPSLNLILSLSDETKVRLGLSRTLARARTDQLNASLSLGVNLTRLTNTDPLISAFSANGGNPFLRPYISDQVDLSIEHYFGGAGYISLAGFYKDLSDFVNPNDSFLYDFSQFVPLELTPAQQAMLGTPLGLISGPTNSGEGSIKGFEFAASVPFDLVTSALDGFGALTSVSFTDSEVTLSPRTGTPFTITVPGLSKWVVNSTLYFERAGFEARVSHRFRSDFLAEVSAISAQRTFRTANGESIIDAQVGYTFQNGPLEGVRLTAQGLNLTDEPFITFQNGDRRQIIDHQSFGRTYLVGASISF